MLSFWIPMYRCNRSRFFASVRFLLSCRLPSRFPFLFPLPTVSFQVLFLLAIMRDMVNSRDKPIGHSNSQRQLNKLTNRLFNDSFSSALVPLTLASPALSLTLLLLLLQLNWNAICESSKLGAGVCKATWTYRCIFSYWKSRQRSQRIALGRTCGVRNNQTALLYSFAQLANIYHFVLRHNLYMSSHQARMNCFWVDQRISLFFGGVLGEQIT